MSVGGLTAVPCIALWVGIRPTPLNVQVIELGDQRGRSFQPGGHKIVLHRGVHLHDVPTSAPNIKIVDCTDAILYRGTGPWFDPKDMTTVFKDTVELSCTRDKRTQQGKKNTTFQTNQWQATTRTFSCNAMQRHATPCNAMQRHATPCIPHVPVLTDNSKGPLFN